jgi:hypothetical protein
MRRWVDDRHWKMDLKLHSYEHMNQRQSYQLAYKGIARLQLIREYPICKFVATCIPRNDWLYHQDKGPVNVQTTTPSFSTRLCTLLHLP